MIILRRRQENFEGFGTDFPLEIKQTCTKIAKFSGRRRRPKPETLHFGKSGRSQDLSSKTRGVYWEKGVGILGRSGVIRLFWEISDSTRMYLTGIEDRIQKSCLTFEIFDFFWGNVELELEIPLCCIRGFPAPIPHRLRKIRKSRT